MVAEATGPAAAGVVDDMVAVDMVEPVVVVGEVMGVIVVVDGVEDTVAVEAEGEVLNPLFFLFI